jgi:hypothetical protein
MGQMTRLAGLLLAAGGLLLGGCATVDDGYWVSSYPVYSRYLEVNEYRTVNPHGLVVVYDPGVMRYSVVRYPGLYWHDGYYYRHQGGHWQRSPRHDGPWLAHRHEPPRIKLKAAEPERRFAGKAVEPRRWEGGREPDQRRPPRERFQGFPDEPRPARIAGPPAPERWEPDPGRWRAGPARAPESAPRGPVNPGSPAWAKRSDRDRPQAIDPVPGARARLETSRPGRPLPAERQDPWQGREGALPAPRERARFAGRPPPPGKAADQAERDLRGQGREPGPSSRAQAPPEAPAGRVFVQRPADQASVRGRRWSAEGEPRPEPEHRAERAGAARAGAPLRPPFPGRAASMASREPVP